MATESSRGLLIAILVVSIASLLVGALQTGLLLRQPAAITPESNLELPAKFDDAVLANITRRITEPYNRGDINALYDVFDELSKIQFSRAELEAQLRGMVELIGKVNSAAFAAAQKQPSQGGRDMYELKYAVKLSGGRFSNGMMTVTVIDRTPEPGIISFVINGTLQ